MRTADNRPITFAEWEYLGKGKFRRRDFRFDLLTQRDKHDVFAPTKAYAPMTVREIAHDDTGGAQWQTL
jgi:hypothetical protein